MFASRLPLLTNPAIRLIITIALMVGAMFAPIAFPWKVPLFAALAMVVVWLETGNLECMGIGRRPLRPTVGWAIVGFLLVVLLIARGIMPVIEGAMGIETDYSAYGALKGNLELVLKLFAGAAISAMIAEEIVYRGFFFHQLTALFGNGKVTRAVLIILGGFVFALPHSEQGMVGMTAVALTGIVFGWLFFRGNKRNLLTCMLAHAMIDVWGLSSLYFGWY